MTYTVLGVIALAILASVAFMFFITRRVIKRFPPEGKFIDIGGNRMHYTGRRTGPAIVFVHSLCGNLRSFVCLDLDRLTRLHRVIMIDRPGAGWPVHGRDSPVNAYAQTRMAAQCTEQLELDKLVLMEHSLGGAISLVVGLNRLHVTCRLALIAPLTHAESTSPGAFRGLVLTSPLVRRLVSWALAILLPIINSRKAIAAVFTPETMPKDSPLRGNDLLELRPRVLYAVSSDLVAALEDLLDTECRYVPMTVPVDVLYGRGDRTLNVERQGEALKQKLDRVNLYIADGDHTLPVTRPVLTTDWVLAMVAGVSTEAETPT